MAFRLVYTGLRVRDIERSLRFYTEILGMEVVDHLESYEPTRGKAVTLRSRGSSQLLELNWYEEGSQFGTAYTNGEELDHLGFEVEDLQDAVKRLEEEAGIYRGFFGLA
jgi:lactoylglutathione lyase